MDITDAPRGELISLIYELIDKVHFLEAEVARLQELLDRKGFSKEGDKPKVPDFVKPNVKHKPKSKDRKKREESFNRLKETPTEQILHSLELCPDCGSKLSTKPSVAYKRQVIDIPINRYIVTEHIVCKSWCLNCKKRFAPEVDLKSVALGKRRIGINLASMISVLRTKLRIPVNLIQLHLKTFYRLNLSEGEIIEITHAVANLGKSSYENILSSIRTSTVVNADETGGRQNGVNGYFWSFNTHSAHLVLYRKSRGSAVVKEILGECGEKFNGVLVSDFYAAYNIYAGFHQRCWVHLLRDIKELKNQYRRHPPLNIWAKRVKGIYEEAKSYTGPSPNTPLGLALEERVHKQQYFEQELKDVCKPYLSKDSPMSTLCGRIITYLPELFMFVRIPEVPSHNNAAERILRHLVIARKISGGTRSEKGSETKSILTSLFDTWTLLGKNPFEECKLLLST